MKSPMKQEVLSWADVDRLIDVLLPPLKIVGTFDAMVLITRGGIIPGGLLAEAIGIRHILTAAVDFPATESAGLMAWPTFMQFPDPSLLRDRRTLIVDDVWGSGRTSTAVKGRIQSSGGIPYTCVLHYNPYRSMFNRAEPDFYGAITDAYIIYPWELDRGTQGLETGVPDIN